MHIMENNRFKVIIVEDVKLELKGTEEIFRHEIPNAEVIGTAMTENEFWELLKGKLIPDMPSSFGHRVSVSKPSLYDLPGMPGSGAMMANALGNAVNFNFSALSPEMTGAESRLSDARYTVRLFTKILFSLFFVLACIQYVNK